jgi:hypothetical protein
VRNKLRGSQILQGLKCQAVECGFTLIALESHRGFGKILQAARLRMAPGVKTKVCKIMRTRFDGWALGTGLELDG